MLLAKYGLDATGSSSQSPFPVGPVALAQANLSELTPAQQLAFKQRLSEASAPVASPPPHDQLAAKVQAERGSMAMQGNIDLSKIREQGRVQAALEAQREANLRGRMKVAEGSSLERYVKKFADAVDAYQKNPSPVKAEALRAGLHSFYDFSLTDGERREAVRLNVKPSQWRAMLDQGDSGALRSLVQKADIEKTKAEAYSARSVRRGGDSYLKLWQASNKEQNDLIERIGDISKPMDDAARQMALQKVTELGSIAADALAKYRAATTPEEGQTAPQPQQAVGAPPQLRIVGRGKAGTAASGIVKLSDGRTVPEAEAAALGAK